MKQTILQLEKDNKGLEGEICNLEETAKQLVTDAESERVRVTLEHSDCRQELVNTIAICRVELDKAIAAQITERK